MLKKQALEILKLIAEYYERSLPELRRSGPQVDAKVKAVMIIALYRWLPLTRRHARQLAMVRRCYPSSLAELEIVESNEFLELRRFVAKRAAYSRKILAL